MRRIPPWDSGRFRLCLSRMDIFKAQLRAILRAAVYGNCRLLIPMVSCLTESSAPNRCWTRQEKSWIPKALPTANNSNWEYWSRYRPLWRLRSAGQRSGLLQHWNERPDPVLSGHRPSERACQLSVRHASPRCFEVDTSNRERCAGRRHSCGHVRREMAGDPVNVPILLGLGIDELSMHALAIPLVKKLIRSMSMDECRELTWQAFQMYEAAKSTAFWNPGFESASPKTISWIRLSGSHDAERRHKNNLQEPQGVLQL